MVEMATTATKSVTARNIEKTPRLRSWHKRTVYIAKAQGKQVKITQKSSPSHSFIHSFIVRRQLVFKIAHQGYSHLRRIIPPQNVADKVRLNLHLNLSPLVSVSIVSLGSRPRDIITISRAPRSTPHSMLEYHSSSCARPSSGSSTKSARGFSSKTSENCLLSLVQLVTVGVTFKNILNPTCRWSSKRRDASTLPALTHLRYHIGRLSEVGTPSHV